MEIEPKPWFGVMEVLKQLFTKGVCRVEKRPLAEQVKTVLSGIAVPAD